VPERSRRQRTLWTLALPSDESERCAASEESRPASLTVLTPIQERNPERDPWRVRARLAYLSEKVKIPGDWGAGEFASTTGVRRPP
jgi:hypothetical protein